MIKIINFSGRKSQGNCAKIAMYIKENIFNNQTNIVNFNELNFNNCNNCNYECFSKNDNSYYNSCHYYKDDALMLYNDIINSKLTIFIIPIYSDYPCSNYFIFKQRSQFTLNSDTYEKYINLKVKFIFISNTTIDNCLNVVKSDFSNCDLKKDVLIISSQKYNQKSILGNLIEQPLVLNEIKNFLIT